LESRGDLVHKQTILLVEDSDSFRTSLRKVLERENYQVMEAINGKEGIRLMAANDIDLIIMDYYLGDMTGADVLKSFGRKISRPLMVLSANTNDEIDHEMRSFGASISLSKPINRQDLLAIVKKTIRNGEPHDGA
jgi:DNA-binding response OmpR family regulator